MHIISADSRAEICAQRVTGKLVLISCAEFRARKATVNSVHINDTEFRVEKCAQTAAEILRAHALCQILCKKR